ncbi:MAG: PAS domain S-box protein, partial [Gammaproteobacteria bacterium]|nr:PAS domain S-box protein [Gammaproteobacteria bacterium]
MIFDFFAKQWRLKLLWLLVFVVFILGLLLWSRDVDVSLHNERLELLSEARDLEARLDQGVLQVASLSLVQYDSLLDVTHGLYGIIGQFSALDNGFRHRTNRVIARYLDLYSSDLDAKIWLLERIKSRAALVRNGLHYLTLVTTELRQVNEPKKGQVIAFLDELYRYTIFPNEVHFNVLQRKLIVLKKVQMSSDKQQKLVDNVLFHMSSNLTSLKILATLKNRYSAVQSVDSFESLRLAYRDFYNASRQRSEQFSYLLWFCILILLWGVTRLVAQLGYSEMNLQRALVDLKKLSLATEQSPISIIITDTHGFVEYVNPHFEQASGYAFADVVGQNFSLMKIEDKSKTECVRLWKTVSAGKTWRGEVNSVRKDGSLYWESVMVSSLKDDKGKVSHYIALKEDISLRKQAEEQVLYQA